MNLDRSLVLTFKRGVVACRSFMGFGVEWDPGVARLAEPAATLTDSDWDLIVKRISWMRIPVIRMMMQTKWCYRGGGQFDWESPEMKLLYRHLDVCARFGIKVILTDWGCERDWLRAPGIKSFADPNYADAIETYMDHLVNTRGYSCIKYFVLGNEPNLEVSDFTRWKKGVELVAAAFKKRGLNRKIGIAGSDESENQSWHRATVDELGDKLAAYDFHRYARHSTSPTLDEVRSGRLYELFETEWGYALARDPEAKAKPMIVGEAGIFHDGFSAGNNPCHMEFLYGLKMADYAAQAAGAGTWCVSAWMLDDNSHTNFNWGMWKNKENGFALKPWFYPWALLCRFVPAGSTVYRSDQPAPVKSGDRRFAALSGVFPVPGLRVLAARSNNKKRPGWTFCLVNRSEEAKELTLRTFDGGKARFKNYLYSAGSAPADSDGFPTPGEEKVCDAGKGILVECPAKAVRFVTSVG